MKKIIFAVILLLLILSAPLHISCSSKTVTSQTKPQTSKIKVTLDYNDGQTASTIKEIDKNVVVPKPEDPKRDKYGFIGWYAKKDGSGDAFDWSKPVTENLTLYAKWGFVVPDPIFKNMVMQLAPEAFTKDKLLLTSHPDLLQVKKLVMAPAIESMKSVEGIEFLTGLTNLDTGNNDISGLDVSKNISLDTLKCKGTFESLDLSKNVKLRWLSCSSAKLKTLDVSKCSELTILISLYNALEALDLSGCSKLKRLEIPSSEKLAALDLSKNPELIYLQLSTYSRSSLVSLDLSVNRKLVVMNLSGNVKLKTIDLRGVIAEGNFIGAADLTALTELKIHDDFKSQSFVNTIKEKRGEAVTISVWSGTPGNYTEVNSNYTP